MLRSLIILLAAISAWGAVPFDNTRSIDLTGLCGVVGGIPTWTNVVQTFPAGTSADTINTYLNTSAPQSTNGAVIQLGAGKFVLDKVLDFGPYSLSHGSGLVINGAGPGLTTLLFSNQTSAAALINVRAANRAGTGTPEWQTDTNMIRDVTSGYAQGSSNITINAAGNVYGSIYDLQPGMIITLDQLNDSALGLNANGYDGSFVFSSAHLLRTTNRAEAEYHRIISVSNLTNLNIWPPVSFPNFQSGLSPQIWWIGMPMYKVGIQNLTIDGSQSTNGSGATHETAIWFQNITDFWCTNVEVIHCRKGMFSCWEAANYTFRHCYTHSPLYDVEQSQYGSNPMYSSFGLIEDCAWEGIATPINIDGGCTLTAIAYCYFKNDRVPPPDTTFMGASIQSHYFGAMGNLTECNRGPGLNLDFIHGSSGTYHTSFRDRWLGVDPAEPLKNNNTYAVFVMGTNRYVNIVGGVMGTNYAVNKDWFVNGADPSNPQQTVYRVGHYGNNQTSGQGDSPTATTLWRDGNWDSVTSATVWDASDSSHTLPASRVYATAPPFTTRFPGIGSDLSPMDQSLPIQLIVDAGTFSNGGSGGGTSGGGASGGIVLKNAVQFSGAVNLRTQ